MYRGHLKAFVSSSFQLSEAPSGWLFGTNSDASVYVGLFATDADEMGRRFEVSPVDPKLGQGNWAKLLCKESLLVLEVALASDYADLATFRQTVEGNRREWVDTNQFDYAGNGGWLTMYRDTTLPAIEGTAVDLTPAKTYDSPYLRCLDGSSTVTINGVNGATPSLDFR